VVYTELYSNCCYLLVEEGMVIQSIGRAEKVCIDPKL